MTVVEFRGPQPIPETANEPLGATAEEFTMPDYAGQETPKSDALWQQQSDTATPENNVELNALEMEIAETEKPHPKPPLSQKLRTLKNLRTSNARNRLSLPPMLPPKWNVRLRKMRSLLTNPPMRRK